jgi:hypothetical protein
VQKFTANTYIKYFYDKKCVTIWISFHQTHFGASAKINRTQARHFLAFEKNLKMEDRESDNCRWIGRRVSGRGRRLNRRGIEPPDAVPLARYEAGRETVERRLAAIEQAVSDRPSDDPHSSRSEDRRTVLSEDRRRTAGRRTLPHDPAQGNGRLSRVRLLRMSDTEDGWRLEAIEEDAAAFRRGNKKHRLSLTGGKK